LKRIPAEPGARSLTLPNGARTGKLLDIAFSEGEAPSPREEKDMETTWQPYTEHGDLTTRSNLTDSVFAFPRQRKEPLTDANHVRNALARFDQVEDVSDADRDLAFANIKKAAAYYGVDVHESDWRELGG
jgi:hypothetical protein